MRFRNGCDKVVTGLSGVHFSSEIIHVTSNRTDRTKLHPTQFNYHYLEFVGAAIMNNCDDPGRGGGYYLQWPLRGGGSIPPERDIFFQASGI